MVSWFGKLPLSISCLRKIGILFCYFYHIVFIWFLLQHLLLWLWVLEKLLLLPCYVSIYFRFRRTSLTAICAETKLFYSFKSFCTTFPIFFCLCFYKVISFAFSSLFNIPASFEIFSSVLIFRSHSEEFFSKIPKSVSAVASFF